MKRRAPHQSQRMQSNRRRQPVPLVVDVPPKAESANEKSPDALLTQREAAGFLSLNNEKTLAAWRVRRQGPPYVKLGTSVRYRRQDLAAWVESRVVHHETASK